MESLNYKTQNSETKKAAYLLEEKIKFELSLYNNQQPSIDKIYEKIFLGNYAAALHKETLLQNNIKYILIASNNMEMYFKDDHDLLIEYMRIPVNDSKKTDITKHFSKSNCFIEKAVLADEGNLLIHCGAGASRSVSFLIAYMISTYSLEYEECVEYVKRIRAEANPNEGFVRQLKDYAYVLKNPL